MKNELTISPIVSPKPDQSNSDTNVNTPSIIVLTPSTAAFMASPQFIPVITSLNMLANDDATSRASFLSMLQLLFIPNIISFIASFTDSKTVNHVSNTDEGSKPSRPSISPVVSEPKLIPFIKSPTVDMIDV